MTGFGPLFQLQVAGSLCPCLEKSENRYARLAVSEINKNCRHVEWSIPSASGSKNGAASFLGGLLFQRNGSSASGGGGGSCKATIILRDSGGDGKPEIFVDPCGRPPAPVATDHDPDVETALTAATTPGYKLNVKLRRVDKVFLDDNQIVLYARKAQSTTHPAKELLRFTALQQSCTNDDDPTKEQAAIPMTSDARNMLVHHFMVIVEWERQRTRDNYDEDDNDDHDDDENQPNFLQARAQKAAHLAKREIEMQKTKRDRQQRKTKLMAEVGGLKYTAIAIANRGNSNSNIT